jgi:hypothetical protein
MNNLLFQGVEGSSGCWDGEKEAEGDCSVNSTNSKLFWRF